MSNLADLNLAYGERARGYRDQNAAALARNAYSRFLAQQRGARRQLDIREETERGAPRLVSGFSRRGLAGPNVQSGVYKKALTDFAQQNFRRLDEAQTDLNRELDEIGFEEANLNTQLQNQLAELELDKQRQIAEAARALTSLRPLIGG